jgi:hypothetical protein
MPKSKLPRWRVVYDVMETYTESVTVYARDNIEADEKAMVARRVKREDGDIVRECIECEEIKA